MNGEGGEAKEVGPLLKGLNWVYDKALEGVAGWESAEEFAKNYTDAYPSREKAIDGLIAWQMSKAAVAGFVTGLGGILVLPVAIPANLASVLFIQLRMIAGIAHIRGYDLKSDQVRSLAFMCLAGSAATDVAKDVGINIGAKLTASAISKISGETLKKINQAVGFRLVTKAGTTGAVNLGRLIPFVGGLLSGAIDAVTTRTMGSTAKSVFRRKRSRQTGAAQKRARVPKRPTRSRPKKRKSE